MIIAPPNESVHIQGLIVPISDHKQQVHNCDWDLIIWIAGPSVACHH
jgi:hypothetical protein